MPYIEPTQISVDYNQTTTEIQLYDIEDVASVEVSWDEVESDWVTDYYVDLSNNYIDIEFDANPSNPRSVDLTVTFYDSNMQEITSVDCELSQTAKHNPIFEWTTTDEKNDAGVFYNSLSHSTSSDIPSSLTVISKPDWISTIELINSNHQIKFYRLQNTTGADRSGIVELRLDYSDGYGFYQGFNIIQHKEYVVPTFSPNSVSVDFAVHNNFTITISNYSDVENFYIASKPNWVTATVNNVNKQILINFQSNLNNTTRTGDFVVGYNYKWGSTGGSKYIPLTQGGFPASLTWNSTTIAGSGGSLSPVWSLNNITINSVTRTDSVGWITMTQDNAHNLTFTASQNPLTTQRQAYVEFTVEFLYGSTTYTKSYSQLITQEGYSAPSTVPSLLWTTKTVTGDFNTQSNGWLNGQDINTVTVTSQSEWISTSADNENITLTIQENPSTTNSREGTSVLSVTLDDSTVHTYTMTITQQAKTQPVIPEVIGGALIQWIEKTVSYEAGSVTNQITANVGYTYSSAQVIGTLPTWLTVSISNSGLITATYTVNSSIRRTVNINIKVNIIDEDEMEWTSNVSFVLTQMQQADFGIQPAWKDINVNVTNQNVIYGKITFRSNITYLGQFWKNPTENFINVNLMGLIRDMIPDYSFNTLNAQYMTGYFAELSNYQFTIQFYSDSTYTTLIQTYTITALPDYSYKDIAYSGNVTNLTHPISHYILKGGAWMTTVVNDTNSTYRIQFGNEGTYIPAHYYSVQLYQAVNSQPSIVDNDTKWKLYQDCESKYTLLYINKYGGWDSLACIANYQEEDSFNRYGYIDNKLEKHNYKSDTTEKIMLNTGYLSDDDSVNISNLFGSHKVYLTKSVASYTDFSKIECVIDESSVKVQTFERNGHKLNNYTFNVTINKTYLRR